MSVPIITFFNNRSDVGKTSLVYHLAWMYADLGLRIVMADLDPQANLTVVCLDEERLVSLWPDNNGHSQTIYGSVKSFLEQDKYEVIPHLEDVGEGSFPPLESPLALLVGDLLLSCLEDRFSNIWSLCTKKEKESFYEISTFWKIMQRAAKLHRADVVLMDLGSNLGAINHAALIAADYVVVPLALDLFLLQSLRSLGPTLRDWHEEWQKSLTGWRKSQSNAPVEDTLPLGNMQSIGYVILLHPIFLKNSENVFDRWMSLIPQEYQKLVLNKQDSDKISVSNDPNRLASLKPYHSLMLLAQESHKPIFHLKPADGALGSQMLVAHSAYNDFRQLAVTIAQRINLSLPTR